MEEKRDEAGSFFLAPRLCAKTQKKREQRDEVYGGRAGKRKRTRSATGRRVPFLGDIACVRLRTESGMNEMGLSEIRYQNGVPSCCASSSQEGAQRREEEFGI